jgi:hypothetical protein
MPDAPISDTLLDSSAINSSTYNQTEIDQAIAKINGTEVTDLLAANGVTEFTQGGVIGLMTATNQTFTCFTKLLPTPMQSNESWASVGCLKGFYCEFV